MYLDRDVGAQLYRFFQPTFADKAPRANHIRDDVDANGLVIGHDWLP
jgi:hypothetical protein